MGEKSKVIDIALNEVGYVEKASNSNLDSKTGNSGSGNYTKYARDLDSINFYNGPKNGYAWCDVFVDWCFYKAVGAERALALLCQPKKSTGAGCGFSMNFYKSKGQLYSSPKQGDQIFFTDGSSVYHTGLVYKVDSSRVYTVEGNTSDSNYVDGNGGKVCKKSYPIGASYIAGYGRPKYDEEADVEVEDTNSNTNTNTNTNKVITTVKVTSENGLNLRKEPNTSSSILKAFANGTSLKIYEVSSNWGRTDGGWICLDYTNYKKANNSSSNSNQYNDGKINCIYDIQEWLNNVYGFGIGQDNIVGNETKAAIVKALQTELNKQFNAKLSVDGIFGPATKNACINVKQGASGNITMIIQCALFIKGYKIGLDKTFGSETANAVKQFQKASGLSVDGIVGKNTFEKLLK